MSAPPEPDALLGYGRQSIDDDDVAAVVRALRSAHLTQGPEVERFEAALRARTGAAHAVAVANGTAALHLANVALGIGRESRVVTSPNTFLASATASAACGAHVAFVDVERATGNLDPERLEQWLRQEGTPAAVTAVHFAGLPCDMERLIELKRRHRFRLIEDAAHALGAVYRADGRLWRVGEHPAIDATCLSFHPVKHVTTAEGGAVLCSDPRLAERLRRLRSHGIDRACGERPFEGAGPAPSWFGPMTELGWNYRLSDLQAALGSSQLEKLERFLERRRALAGRYRELLDGRVELLDPGGGTRQHAWHLFVARVPAEHRDALMARLARRRIGTQLHYYPVPLQPWFRSRGRRPELPEAVRHARTSLSLPLHPGLSDQDVERVAEALTEELLGLGAAAEARLAG